MFDDRTHAGQVLAEKVAEHNFKKPLILAVPRGGLAVASPIAEKLQCQMSVLIAKKVGHPLNSEVAIGAIMPDGSLIHDNQYVTGIGVKQENFDKLVAEARKDFDARVKVYESILVKNHEVKDRDIIIVDDGIATGYTIMAAVKWIKKWNPASVTIAVPVAPNDITHRLRNQQVNIVCIEEPNVFSSVGVFYKDFSQMTDEDALEIHRLAPGSIVRV